MTIVNPLFPWQRLLYLWFSDLYHCWKKFLVQQPIYTHRKIIKAPLLHQRLGSQCLSLSLSPSLYPSLRLILWSMETCQAHSPARAFKTSSRGRLCLCEWCKPCSRVLLVLCINQRTLASFSLSLSYRLLRTTRFRSIKGLQQQQFLNFCKLARGSFI